MSNTPVQPILVAACGNTLAGDDAFGPLVARALGARTPPGVEVIDLGMRPAGLVDHLPGRRGVILVDAALSPDHAAGALLDLDFFDPRRPALCADRLTSTHAFSLAGQLELAQALGMLPPVVRLVALVARNTQVGSAAAIPAQTLHDAADLILNRIQWLRNL
jgi:hydrogenase maturation protease